MMIMAASSYLFAQEYNRSVDHAISLERAVEIATREVAGKVLEAELEKGVYEVKILTGNGERIKIKIDPRDGTILRKGRVVKVTNGFGK